MQTAENRIALSLASSAEGILFADNEGRITHANAAAERLLGSGGGSLEGTNCADTLKRIAAANDAAYARESADGNRPALAIETAPVFNDDRSFAGTVIGVTGVTKGSRGGGNSRLSLCTPADGSAQGQHELRELVHDIANDFNNIMTAIIGNISLARTEVSQDAHVYKTLAYVEKASARARDLALRLRALAHPSLVVEPEMDDEN